jgi:hypothetical protein
LYPKDSHLSDTVEAVFVGTFKRTATMKDHGWDGWVAVAEGEDVKTTKAFHKKCYDDGYHADAADAAYFAELFKEGENTP